MTNYVYSTLTASNNYTGYTERGNDRPLVSKQVLIAGGHGVSNKHFMTPMGVVTAVSDEDLEFLENNPEFKAHKERGFIKVQKKKVETERVAADMVTRDKSAPVVPQDYNEQSEAKPVLNKKG